MRRTALSRASLIAVTLVVACNESFDEPSDTVPPKVVIPVGEGGIPEAGAFDSGRDGGSDACTPPTSISLEPAFGGAAFSAPVEMQEAGGHTYIVEQGGTIKVVEPAGTALDISDILTYGSEAGLLGLAFDPAFATNRYVYVDYTRPLDTPVDDVVFKTRIARFTASADGLTFDKASEKVILEVDQPFTNHNGGKIAFGPDGFLYIALGDGGAGGDPNGNGQNKDALLGKILRIDPNGADPYAIPTTNPFAAGGGRGEIYAYGFRNPFRFSFDKAAPNTLWVGDVGQDAFEEVDTVTLGGNYGWNTKEGTHCYNAATCDSTGLIDPIVDYPHAEGISVIGGYVYRGTKVPSLVGKFIFGDFGTGNIWGVTAADKGKNVKSLLLLASGAHISTFGQDSAGEVYVGDLQAGTFRRIAPAPANSDAGSDSGCN